MSETQDNEGQRMVICDEGSTPHLLGVNCTHPQLVPKDKDNHPTVVKIVSSASPERWDVQFSDGSWSFELTHGQVRAETDE